MKISHKIKDEICRESVSSADNTSFLMISTRGHFFSQPANPKENITNFHGWMNISDKEYKIYKSIESIMIEKLGQPLVPIEVSNNVINISRVYNDMDEEFQLVKNGVIYTVDSRKDKQEKSINLNFDFREIFSNDDKGRVYKIYKEKFVDQTKLHMINPINKEAEAIIVEYSKYTDNSLASLDKKYYLIIYGASKFSCKNDWLRKDYSFDSYRNSASTFYVYDGLRLMFNEHIQLIFTFSEDKTVAAEKLFDILNNTEVIKEVHKRYMEKFLYKKYSFALECGMTGDIATAYINSFYALEGLSMNLQVNNKRITGLWAGVPWFFQFWARDENISLKALMLEDKNDFVKTVLLKHLNEIHNDGRIPNIYPDGGLGTADGTGWFFKRFHEYFDMLNEKELMGQFLSLYDIKYIRERLLFSIRQLWKHYGREGLIWNDKLETWMDTNVGEGVDDRRGFRIEIQCLFLAMLRFMNVLNNQLANKLVKKHNKLISVSKSAEDYVELEREMAEKVREKFFIDGKLCDGVGDCTARPNIFLAYYLYPELLDNNGWEQAFDYALDKLWCQWDLGTKDGGGLSTIDKNSPIYQPKYTGQNNLSYHRGDSWFWVNNISAVALLRLNKEKYFSYAKKILNASTEDILAKGYIGYASEITSSSVFEPAGCLCQTWSMATFIELIHQMYM